MITLPPLGRYRIDAVLLLVALVWGGSYLAAKVLTEQTSVGVVLALRFLVAALALLLIWALSRPRRPSRAELAVGVLLGLSQATILWLETAGVAVTSATNAGLIISLTIILTPILESVAARNWLPRSFFIAGRSFSLTVGRFLKLRARSAALAASAVVEQHHIATANKVEDRRINPDMGVSRGVEDVGEGEGMTTPRGRIVPAGKPRNAGAARSPRAAEGALAARCYFVALENPTSSTLTSQVIVAGALSAKHSSQALVALSFPPARKVARGIAISCHRPSQTVGYNGTRSTSAVP